MLTNLRNLHALQKSWSICFRSLHGSVSPLRITPVLLCNNQSELIRRHPSVCTFYRQQLCAAFTISTIVLAVDNDNLKSEIDDLTTSSNTPSTASSSISTRSAESTTNTESTKTTIKSTTFTETTKSTSNPTTMTPDPDIKKFRLPSTIKPEKYDLYFYPNLDTGLFKGRNNITLNVEESRPDIILHNKGLQIESALLDGNEVAYLQHEELLIITPKDQSPVTVGKKILEIHFSGDMKNRIVGLYESTYSGSDGSPRKIATSKFEPTFARQAFPCFDEPAFKAKFHVHIEKPKGNDYLALSNFPKISEQDTPNGTLVHFQETDIVMSTYLACFIVCDFKFTPNGFRNKGGKNDFVPFNVYATPEQLDKTKYAGDTGKKIMEYYVEYFNIPYPLPKLDMIAIPDFVSGAMEHWGLVTYRETALLYNEKYHSAGNKQRVATVVAHELAHSWFGNLVTMSWWDNLWLNEGFASYIEYKGVDHAEPTWQIMQQFLIDDMHTILDVDSKISSHPIIQTVETPDQITEVFDAISYAKGASVLRMLENVVGPVNFQQGVTDYLNKFAYGNAVSDDFIQAIEQHFPNHGITEFLNTFTHQTGYPVVTVEHTEDNNFKLTQKRFLMGSDEKFTSTWKIPIRYRIIGDSSESQVFWFDKDAEYLIIKRPENKIIKFNPEQVGFYRVNYPKDYWLELIRNYAKLSVGDRTHLLEESFSLAAAGLLSYEIPFNLSKQLINEIEYVPWGAFAQKLDHLKSVLGSSIDNFVRDIAKNAYEKLTWVEKPTDGHLTKLIRGEILNIACTYNIGDCLEEAGKRFKTWFKENTELSPDLRAMIYRYGITKLNETEFNAVLERYANEIDAGEKLKLMYGIANVDSEDLLKKFITWIWDEKNVRSQDYLIALQLISTNPKGKPLVWDYVTRNWEDLVKRYTLNDRNLGRMILGITRNFKTPEEYNEMKQFYKKYPDAGAGERAREQALENVMNNIQWIEQYKDEVEAWLSNYCLNCR